MENRPRRWMCRTGGLLARLRDEQGFSLVELMAALSIMTFGFLALAGAASTGARLLAESKQRQSASEIASRQLEHLRNIPFNALAHTAALTHSSVPDNPDYFVSANGLAYDYSGDGDEEPLVIAGSGQVAHTEALTVGSTALTAYRFVTWVDDPDVSGTQDYKRLVVVVAYNTPVNTGRPTQVRASALVTPGDVTVGGSSVAAGEGQTSSPTPSPSPSATGSCSGDETAPTGTFTVLSGTGAATGYTASVTVTISLAPSDPCTPIQIRLSNDNVTYSSPFTYQSSSPTATWRLTDGDGSKSIWARFSDARGNTRTVGPRTVVLDSTSPTQPGTLTRTASCSGTQRTVVLSWSVASDANLLGYRVYRSIDGGEWTPVATASGTTEDDTHAKGYDSVRFRVVAYDRAGNEGPNSNEISLSKNQCS